MGGMRRAREIDVRVSVKIRDDDDGEEEEEEEEGSRGDEFVKCLPFENSIQLKHAANEKTIMQFSNVYAAGSSQVNSFVASHVKQLK